MHALHHPLFIKFMAYFNGNQDYFECHEVLEDYWNEVAPKDKTHPLVGYLLLAVSLYHWRRGNLPGAKKSMRNGIGKLGNGLVGHPEFRDGIDAGELLRSAGDALARMDSGSPFSPFEIRITDPALAGKVRTAAAGLQGENSPSLIHKHMQRRRTDMSGARKKGRDSRH
ncbi:DUF309 domain-containing protein [Edaphobacillus lindanitolerans]|uniref:DUF309 domain-containing protein n=1 Tax=Edaphobacillus lindanitolerans TaxID=550447 RepID=A0A1U7PIY4_9BACI|nr:DUF309 domain-containing protein [Edaphobacillus lindanitolerans]SIT66726.1 hypothetical protein SAMN05428946_0120 [Edaphobacillus lindanitolerans]